jgi:hypothetical protein
MPELQDRPWEFPAEMQEAIDSGAITLAEASAMEDVGLSRPDQDMVMLPKELWGAGQRLYLFEASPEGLLH